MVFLWRAIKTEYGVTGKHLVDKNPRSQYWFACKVCSLKDKTTAFKTFNLAYQAYKKPLWVKVGVSEPVNLDIEKNRSGCRQ